MEADEFMLMGCLLWLTPGLGKVVLGDGTHPGEGTAMEGDFKRLGELVGDRTLREELITWGDFRGPDWLEGGMLTICEGVCGDFRLADGEGTSGECTWLSVGDLRWAMPGEFIWLMLMVRSEGLRPSPREGA